MNTLWLLSLTLGACGSDLPAIGAVGSLNADPRGGKVPLNAPLSTAKPPGKAPGGGPPSGGPPAGDSGVGLAFNNADSLCQGGDGSSHTLYVEDGQLKHLRAGQAPVTLSKGPVTLMSIGSDGKDVLLAAWAEGKPSSSIRIAWSVDNGKSWTPASDLSREGMAPTARVWRQGSETRAAVAWHVGGANEITPGHVWAATYQGDAWSKPVQVDESPKSALWPSLGGHGDETWVVWRDNRGSDPKRWSLYMSTLGSKGWGDERSLGIEGHDPSVCMTDNGRLHIGYHHQMSALYTYSDDDGKTWSEPKVLDEGLFVQAECQGNTVALTYERLLTRGNWMDPKNKGVGLLVSSDAGKTFKAVQVGSGQPGMVRPSTMFTPDGLVVEWVDRSGASPKLASETVKLDGR